MLRDRVLLEASAHLEPVHVRHHHVEQHEVAIRPFAHRERGDPARRCGDVEILGGQPRLKQLDVGGDVIHDKDTSSH
jgi:hypothetical protein